MACLNVIVPLQTLRFLKRVIKRGLGYRNLNEVFFFFVVQPCLSDLILENSVQVLIYKPMLSPLSLAVGTCRVAGGRGRIEIINPRDPDEISSSEGK